MSQLRAAQELWWWGGRTEKVKAIHAAEEATCRFRGDFMISWWWEWWFHGAWQLWFSMAIQWPFCELMAIVTALDRWLHCDLIWFNDFPSQFNHLLKISFKDILIFVYNIYIYMFIEPNRWRLTEVDQHNMKMGPVCWLFWGSGSHLNGPVWNRGKPPIYSIYVHVDSWKMLI